MIYGFGSWTVPFLLQTFLFPSLGYKFILVLSVWRFWFQIFGGVLHLYSHLTSGFSHHPLPSSVVLQLSNLLSPRRGVQCLSHFFLLRIYQIFYLDSPKILVVSLIICFSQRMASLNCINISLYFTLIALVSIANSNHLK